ncbi:MAG: dihydrofolate reductase [Chloroflexi bacterium]|nr:dihydrofolate reductase [Chloroflexota bacterium]
MRKLKLQVQLSVDGYIAGTNGEMDWMVWDWDDALKQYVTELTDPVDCIVLGRKLAEGFIPYWAAIAANPDDPQFTDGKKFTDTPKVVFTKTLESTDWGHTVLAKGDLVDEITKLKQQDGGDIIAYGGAAFVSALIQHGLIDELHLFINPTAIGSGMTIFKELDGRQHLTLIRSTSFDCGIVVLQYAPKQNNLAGLMGNNLTTKEGMTPLNRGGIFCHGLAPIFLEVLQK